MDKAYKNFQMGILIREHMLWGNQMDMANIIGE
jgi:hypothetical protein